MCPSSGTGAYTPGTGATPAAAAVAGPSARGNGSSPPPTALCPACCRAGCIPAAAPDGQPMRTRASRLPSAYQSTARACATSATQHHAKQQCWALRWGKTVSFYTIYLTHQPGNESSFPHSSSCSSKCNIHRQTRWGWERKTGRGKVLFKGCFLKGYDCRNSLGNQREVCPVNKQIRKTPKIYLYVAGA